MKNELRSTALATVGIVVGWLLCREAFIDWYLGGFFESLGFAFNTAELIQYIVPFALAILLSSLFWQRAKFFVIFLIISFGLSSFVFFVAHWFANS